MKRHTMILSAVVLALLVVTGQPLFAQTGNMWTVSYYNNPSWSGGPVLGTYAPSVDFNWGTVPPGPGMPATNWTATMTSTAYFYYTGTYIFQALADDEISLSIDGVTYLNTIGQGMAGKTMQVYVPMTVGNHNLVVQYRQYTGTAYAYLNWAYVKPGGGLVYTPLALPMPAGTPVVVTPAAPVATPTPACDPAWSCTCPVQATSVTTQYGDYTPCIQQNLPQSQCFQSDGQWNSPNLGSIQTEPNIQVWGACTPGAQQCMQLACNQAPEMATCSKTGAGWFYYGPCPTLYTTATPTP